MDLFLVTSYQYIQERYGFGASGPDVTSRSLFACKQYVVSTVVNAYRALGCEDEDFDKLAVEDPDPKEEAKLDRYLEYFKVEAPSNICGGADFMEIGSYCADCAPETGGGACLYTIWKVAVL